MLRIAPFFQHDESWRDKDANMDSPGASSDAKRFQAPVFDIQNYSFQVTQYSSIQHHTECTVLQTQFDSSLYRTDRIHGDTSSPGPGTQRSSSWRFRRPGPKGQAGRYYYMAYLWVQVLAVFSYLCRSVLYMWAISGTKGSSGFGSVSREQMDSSTWKSSRLKMLVGTIAPSLQPWKG